MTGDGVNPFWTLVRAGHPDSAHAVPDEAYDALVAFVEHLPGLETL
jgi:hypothetical protein